MLHFSSSVETQLWKNQKARLNSYSVLTYTAILIVFCANQAFAQKTVSYDGYTSLDASYKHKDDFPEFYTKAKLEFNFKLTPSLETQIDIRGNSQSSTIQLKEVHASVDLPTNMVLRFGNIKKPLSIEELTSREDLYHIDVSQINEFLAPLGYLGRDPGVQVYKKHENSSKLYYPRAGISYNQSGLLGINGRITRGFFNAGYIGIDAIYQFCTIRSAVLPEYYPVHSYVMGLDFSKEGQCWYHELEGFYGLDPIETQLNEISGQTQSVHFIAAKWLSAYHSKLGSSIIKAVEPLVLCSILCPDIQYVDANRIELLAGINIYLDEEVIIRFNGDLILTTNKYNTEDRVIGANSKVIFESIIKW
jgi:hypothetical protein